MKRWLFLIVLGVAGGLIFRKYGVEGIYIASPSMEPTLPVGAQYFVDKFTVLFRAPKRGEIVVLHSPVAEDIDLVKRVIGLPGETISIKDKKVFINEGALSEPYAKHKRKNEILLGDNLPPIQIPEDHYFVLGDNRDESKDSASWKNTETGEPVYFVKRETIKGRLMLVLE